MFNKSPRFRTGGPNSSEAAGKSSPASGREPSATVIRVEDAHSGVFSVKRVNSIEGEPAQSLKRPSSTDRKLGPPDKKKPGQRELKRTTSSIPRASTQRARTPTSREEKKSGRKSETSIKFKDKDVLDDSLGKDKKNEPAKTVKPGTANLSDERTGGEISKKSSDSPKKDPTPKTKIGIARNIHVSDGAGKFGEKSHPAISSTAVNVMGKSLETQYTTKKTVYALMTKEFEEKQKVIRDQYKILQEMRKKILATTGKDLPEEETIKLGEVGPPFVISHDVLKKHFDMMEKRTIVTFETKVFNDLQVDFSDFESSFEVVLNEMQEIWLQLMPAAVRGWKEMTNKLVELNPEQAMEYEKEEKSFELATENAKYLTKSKLDGLTVDIKKLYLNREILKQEMQTMLDTERFSMLLSKDYKEMVARLKEVEEELAKEKVRTEDLMEKKIMLEECRIAESEKIESLEQTIEAQQNQLAELENQCKALKQKELISNRGIGGLKPKDIKDLKAKSELLKALENHITELTTEYNMQKKTYQSRISELEQALSEKEEALKMESEAKESLEISLADAEERIRSVREKKKMFVDMVDKTKQIIQTTTGGSTKREEQLWTELEATKIVVKGYQDQLNKLTEEKNKIMLKFQTISEDKSNQNAERLAADLVRKEEIIKGLKDQVTQLQTTCEEHSVKYNKLLAQIKEVHEKMDGKADVAALSKQLGDIKMQKNELQEVVKDLVSHNEELETALIQRSLELDQRDRLVKQQCNLLKMRDELTDLVRGKDEVQYHGVRKAMEQSSRWEKKAEKIYKDLEKRANESDDIYRVLVEKQKQVEKLTKLVKIMEDQQDRAQEQRVRFESKISELQRQLLEGKSKTPKISLFGN